MKKPFLIQFIFGLSVCFALMGIFAEAKFGFNSALVYQESIEKQGEKDKSTVEKSNNNKKTASVETQKGNTKNTNTQNSRSNNEKTENQNSSREDKLNVSEQAQGNSVLKSNENKSEFENSDKDKHKKDDNLSSGILATLWNLLIPLLLGFTGLLLIGGIGFFIYRILRNAKHERATTQEGFRSIGAKQSSLRQDVNQLKTTAELLSKQLSEQRNEITALKSQSQRRDSSSSEQTKTLPTFSPSYSSPAPEFPVSVETYLAKNAGGAAFGKHDPLFGTLKENTEDGAFYLIRDGVLNDDARYAVPRTKQFVTKDDFVYHYSNYYSCANPSGGEVWIKKPSTVRRTTDGWKLDTQGELEIR